MEGDREAVGLVAHLLDQVERGRAARQHDRRLVPGHEDLLVRLGQAADRDVQPQALQLRHRGGELGLAAVDHEQVRAAAKALVGHALRGVAPPQHLGHGDEVVGLGERGLDLEAAVLGLVGPAVGEDHHRRHGEVPVQRGDVEALDPHRRRVEGERALQLQQRLVGAIVGIARAHHVAHQGVPGVLGGHVEQAALLAALRAPQAAAAPALLGEPPGDELGVGQLAGQVDLRGDVGGLVVVALDKARHELLLAHVEALVEDELRRADRAALAHHEDAGAADGLLAVEADEVQAHARREDHLLAVVERVEVVEARLDAAGALEVEVRRGGAHLVGELPHYLGAVAAQKALDLAHVARVLHGVDHAGADARPAPHVVVEARAALLGQHHVGDGRLIRVLLEQALGALPLRAGGKAYGDDLAQGVDGLAGGAGVGVGAEVARALAVLLARVLDRGEDVGLGDGDERVGLVVLVVHVEVGVVLRDEVALQDERLVLGAHHHVVEGLDHLHHERDLLALVLQRHVLAHAGAQVLGLADVDDLALGVLPEVAARVGGDPRDLLGEGGLHAAVARGAARGLAHEASPLGRYFSNFCTWWK